MDTDRLLQLDEQICFLLYRTTNQVIRAYRPLLEPLNLTYPQYLTMLVLWEDLAPELTVSALGARLDLDSGTLTPLLKRLENIGYITRTRSREDERRVLVGLTAAGRELKEKARGVPEALLCSLGGDLRGVLALRENLKNILETMYSKEQTS